MRHKLMKREVELERGIKTTREVELERVNNNVGKEI